jgi:uncharacterized protein YlzI (FlbEa/FlbD family)
VIILTRLGGHQLAVNPDLIERAESTPDTVITMLDGHKLVVTDSLPEVVDAVRSWRASVAAEAYTLSHCRGEDGAGTDDVRGVDRATRLMSEMASDDVTAHSALGSSLARVLRLPPLDRDRED